MNRKYPSSIEKKLQSEKGDPQGWMYVHELIALLGALHPDDKIFSKATDYLQVDRENDKENNTIAYINFARNVLEFTAKPEELENILNKFFT